MKSIDLIILKLIEEFVFSYLYSVSDQICLGDKAKITARFALRKAYANVYAMYTKQIQYESK